MNWNPWFASDSQSLEDVCIPFDKVEERGTGTVETEFKLRVTSVSDIVLALIGAGFTKGESLHQRDEYFDTPQRYAAQNDYAIRLRSVNDAQIEAAFKGPRFFTQDDASSRLEFEVPVNSMEEARSALAKKGLIRTWFLEKRRTEFVNLTTGIRAAIDELPIIGSFLEIEGQLSASRALLEGLSGYLGTVERRNYKEIVVAEVSDDAGDSEIQGLDFQTESQRKV